jgi:hypothetical protein
VFDGNTGETITKTTYGWAGEIHNCKNSVKKDPLDIYTNGYINPFKQEYETERSYNPFCQFGSPYEYDPEACDGIKDGFPNITGSLSYDNWGISHFTVNINEYYLRYTFWEILTTLPNYVRNYTYSYNILMQTFYPQRQNLYFDKDWNPIYLIWKE